MNILVTLGAITNLQKSNDSENIEKLSRFATNVCAYPGSPVSWEHHRHECKLLYHKRGETFRMRLQSARSLVPHQN